MTSSLLLLACSGGNSDADSAATCEPATPTCVDQMILDLSLKDDKTSKGDVTTAADGADFLTSVDASAGGYGNETKHAWTYVRFTAEGAEKVEIDDETALESLDWDMALRRFIIRLNGGDSGPGCVGAASFRNQTYEELTEIPEGVTYAEDEFYTDDCTIVNDSSGLENSPQVVMAPWWEYSTCVETTGTPFLIQSGSGDVLKFVVESYYEGEGQEACNSQGSPTTEGGYYQLRWAWM